jgi:cell division protein FtsQ
MSVALRQPLMANRPVRVADKTEIGGWRRKGMLALAAGLTTALALGFDAISDPDFMPIEVVRVEGDLLHVSRSGLEQKIAPLARSGFFAVDLDRIYAAATSEPWVEDVSIRRIWPRGLLIRIREREPFARWSQGAFVTAEGEVFEAAGVEQPQLPVLSGPPGKGREMVDAYVRFERRLNEIGLRIGELVQDDRGSWRIVTASGLQLRLGREHIDAQMQRLIEHFPSVAGEDSRAIEEIDLRYTNGFAIAWRSDDASQSMKGGH